MHNRALGLLAVCLISLSGSAQASAAGPTVTVRVEGVNNTLLPETQVTLGDSPVAGCPAHSASAALDAATNHNWDQQQFTQTILGETHNFSDSDYWAEWVSDKYGGGICSDILNEGDKLLLLVDRTPPPTYASLGLPLNLSVPATAAPGAAVTATVTEVATDNSVGPSASALVAGDGASATTAADGTATLSFTARGPHVLKASKTTTRSAPVTLCITDGADGFCNTSKPGTTTSTTTTGSAAPCPTTGTDGRCGSPDRTAPVGAITGLPEQARFRRGKAPRTLAGKVDVDPSGLKDVRLRLTRTLGPRCSYYSGLVERFVTTKACGATGPRFFSIGSAASWSYLLPFDLPVGRYVLDVQVVDQAGNVSRISARGRDRIVFGVR